jgi:hypothetical protein
MRVQAIRVVRLAVEGFDDAVVHWHVAERETGMISLGGARLRKTKGDLGQVHCGCGVIWDALC